MARDYGRTGGLETGGNFVKLNTKEGVFDLPNGEKRQAIGGFLERVDLEFKDADSQHDLPARWHVNLQVSMKIEESPKTYAVSLSSHWANPIMANLLNGIAGCLEHPAWSDPEDRFLKIYLTVKQPTGKRAYCSASAFKTEAFGDFCPNKFEWNDAGRFYVGVPSDLEEAGVFWLSVAHYLAKQTGGFVTGADKASIPLPAPWGATASENDPTPAPAEDVLTPAKAYLERCLTAGDAFVDAVEKTFAVLVKKNAPAGDMRKMAAHCTELGTRTKALPWGHIDMHGKWKQPDPPAATQPAVAADDLPF